MSTTVRIVKTPDVLHGKPRIEGTRVGVFQLGEAVRGQDWSIEEAADQFGLESPQVRAAIEYYDAIRNWWTPCERKKRLAVGRSARRAAANRCGSFATRTSHESTSTHSGT